MLIIDNIEKKSNKEKQQIVMKSHKQFGHGKSSTLIDLMKTSGITDSRFLDSVKELDQSCDLFISSKKLFSFSRYSNFCNFLSSFPLFPDSKGQMEVE